MPKVECKLEEAEEAALPSSEDEEDEGNDRDTCSAAELEQFFQTKYSKSDELATTLQKEYVLNLCSDSSFSRLAAGLSNGEVQIFDIKGERSLKRSNPERVVPPVQNSRGKQKPINICGVQFLDDTSDDCILIGTTNGVVRLFDLRTGRVEGRFMEDVNYKHIPDNGPKNIICFERNANSRILCTGTEKCENAVYMIFYDIRQKRQLGMYFDSHDEDITSIRFHPCNPDRLVTGSTDGLINYFDIKKSNESDALLTTINTENSVQKLNWHRNIYGKYIASCISHTDFKVYDLQETDLIVGLNRKIITSTMKREDSSNCNLINAHNMDDDSLFLLAGTNLKMGEVLRALHLQDKQLTPLADFDGNRQIVRDSVFNTKYGTLITAGESGLITLWTPESYGLEGQLISISGKLKSKTKHNSVKKEPY